MTEAIKYSARKERRSIANKSIDIALQARVKLIGDHKVIAMVTREIAENEIVLDCVIPERLAFNEQSLLEIELGLGAEDHANVKFFARFLRYDEEGSLVVRICDSESHAFAALKKLFSQYEFEEKNVG